jgi:hypothetical protein
MEMNESAIRGISLVRDIITVPESPMLNVSEATVVTVPRLELVKEAGKQYAKCGMISTAGC